MKKVLLAATIISTTIGCLSNTYAQDNKEYLQQKCEQKEQFDQSHIFDLGDIYRLIPGHTDHKYEIILDSSIIKNHFDFFKVVLNDLDPKQFNFKFAFYKGTSLLILQKIDLILSYDLEVESRQSTMMEEIFSNLITRGRSNIKVLGSKVEEVIVISLGEDHYWDLNGTSFKANIVTKSLNLDSGIKVKNSLLNSQILNSSRAFLRVFTTETNASLQGEQRFATPIILTGTKKNIDSNDEFPFQNYPVAEQVYNLIGKKCVR